MTSTAGIYETLTHPDNISRDTISRCDLGALINVHINGAIHGDALIYDAINDKWVPGIISGGGTVTSITAGVGLSGGVITNTGTISLAAQLKDLLDVSTTLPTNGQMLAYDSASNAWIPANVPTTGVTSITAGVGLSGGVITNTGTISLAAQLKDLLDVSTTLPTNGQMLAYNTSLNAWTPANVPSTGVTSITAGIGLSGGTITTSGTLALAANLGDLLDVNTTTLPTNGQMLAYNTSLNAWTPANVPTTGVTSITAGVGLSGGVITNTGTISLAAQLKDLLDVSITTPVINDVLMYDSVNAVWINGTPNLSIATNALISSGVSVNVASSAAPTAGQILTATSGTTATWQTPAASGGAFKLLGSSTVSNAVTAAVTGANNFVVGDSTTAPLLTSGTNNYIIGNSACKIGISTATQNIIMGMFAAYNLNGSYNVILSHNGVWYPGSSLRNIIIGANACQGTNSSSYHLDTNVFIGHYVANSVHSTLTNNVVIGGNACTNAQTYNNCVSIGANSSISRYDNNSISIGYASGGSSTVSTNDNICIGYQTGANITTAKYCLLLGQNVSLPFGNPNTSDSVTVIGHNTNGTFLYPMESNSALYGGNQTTNHYFNATIAVQPVSDGIVSCGSATHRWSEIFAANATINVSDRNKKENITKCDLGLDFINALTPVSFKWRDYLTNIYTRENGCNHPDDIIDTIEVKHKRIHYGLIAQDIRDTLQNIGKTTEEFAGYIESEEIHPLSGKKQKGYGLRYVEFIAPIIRAIQELTERLEAVEDAIKQTP